MSYAAALRVPAFPLHTAPLSRCRRGRLSLSMLHALSSFPFLRVFACETTRNEFRSAISMKNWSRKCFQSFWTPLGPEGSLREYRPFTNICLPENLKLNKRGLQFGLYCLGSTGFPKSVMSGKSGDHQVIMDAKAADGLQNHYCVFKGTADADPTFIYQEPLPVTGTKNSFGSLRGQKHCNCIALTIDYGDDPCPYATFQLPEKTPGRPKLTNPASGRASTLSRWPVRHTGNALSSSGNVYSGPYNSVEGAQVQQLLSKQATLPLRVRFVFAILSFPSQHIH